MGVKRFSNHAMLGLKVKLFFMSCLGWLDQFVMHCGIILTFPKIPFVFPSFINYLKGYQSYEEVTPLVVLHML
jgi:hypothetical protein